MFGFLIQKAHHGFQWLGGLIARRFEARAYDDFQRSFQEQREAARARHGKTKHIDQAQRAALHAALAGGKRR